MWVSPFSLVFLPTFLIPFTLPLPWLRWLFSSRNFGCIFLRASEWKVSPWSLTAVRFSFYNLLGLWMTVILQPWDVTEVSACATFMWGRTDCWCWDLNMRNYNIWATVIQWEISFPTSFPVLGWGECLRRRLYNELQIIVLFAALCFVQNSPMHNLHVRKWPKHCRGYL